MTDSGDVSSIKDVDILELLRVGSSCQSEHILSYMILIALNYFEQFPREILTSWLSLR